MNRISWEAGVSILEGSRIVYEAAAEAKEDGYLKVGDGVFHFEFRNRSENGACSFHAESSGLSRGRFFIA